MRKVLWDMPWRERFYSREWIDGEAGAKGVGGRHGR